MSVLDNPIVAGVVAAMGPAYLREFVELEKTLGYGVARGLSAEDAREVIRVWSQDYYRYRPEALDHVWVRMAMDDRATGRQWRPGPDYGPHTQRRAAEELAEQRAVIAAYRDPERYERNRRLSARCHARWLESQRRHT